MINVQLRFFGALLALVLVTSACGRNNPVGPTPLPTNNLVAVVDGGKRVDKGRSLDILVHYELAQATNLSFVPRLDAAGAPTEARESTPQRVGPGVGEVLLRGATVPLSSSVEETRYLELVQQDARNPADKIRSLVEWPVRWYWPVGIAGK